MAWAWTPRPCARTTATPTSRAPTSGSATSTTACARRSGRTTASSSRPSGARARRSACGSRSSGPACGSEPHTGRYGRLDLVPLKLPSALKLPPAVSSVLPRVLASEVGGRPVSGVPLNGAIAAASGPVPRSVINLAAVESALTRAFEAENAVAVALVINSPGGSPTQSQLVADRIRGLAAEHELPVLAFCEDVAASGGYWLACAADEIFACPTSLVGSIGVVSGGFGLTGLIERVGIERGLHTAGPHQARV